MRRTLCLLLLLLAPAASFAAGGRPLRMTAWFLSGRKVDGAEIHDWHDAKAEPRLDSQRLFFDKDRVVWLEDRWLPLAEEPEAYLEFFGGDRLPGRVLAYRSGGPGTPYQSAAHLVVQPKVDVDWPDGPRQNGVAISPRWLKRVVWRRLGTTRYEPATLHFRDGRRVSFRALRWEANAVRLLLAQDTRVVAFDDIAELHLPASPSWDAWCEQLALLSPECQGLLLQCETSDGVRLTASMSRFQANARGGNQDQWLHGFQPAWSLDPLWLKHRTIRVRRFFEPQQPLLTVLEPLRTGQHAVLAQGWEWQRDRNVLGGQLRCDIRPFGWGFGVHAASELTFELPAYARAFRSQYGLDRQAGDGGCVRMEVALKASERRTLHQSAIIVGSAAVHDTHRLELPASDNARELILSVDPVYTERPAGADPLEIRDHADWLQPELEVDRDALRRDVLQRGPALIPTWQDWTLADPESLPVLFGQHQDDASPQRPRFLRVAGPRAKSYTLQRTLEVLPTHKFLVISACRQEKRSGPSRLQVRVNGEQQTELEIPIRRGPSPPEPLVVSLENWSGRTVKIELVHTGEPGTALVEWHGMSLSERHPSTDAE